MTSGVAETLPHSVEAEQAVIGGLLIKPDCWAEASTLLRREDFYLQQHRVLWEAIADLARSGDAPDLVTLQRVPNLDRQYLGQLMEQTPSAANIVAYARIVLEHAKRRQLIRVGADMMMAARGRDPLADVLDRAQRSVLDIDAPGAGGAASMDDVATRWLRVQEARERGDTGLLTGFTELDGATNGLHPGELIYIAARPAMGKTALGLALAANIAMAGSPVLAFSMEMADVDLFDRLVAGRLRADLQALRAARLPPEDRGRLRQAATALRALPLVVDDTPALTTEAILSRARRHKQRHGLALLVVDYLGLIKSKGENRTREVGRASRDLKAIAKNLGVPVLCLAQLNRGLENRPDKDKRPMLADLRDAGDIEQDADVVAFIYRDEVYHPDSEDRGIAEVIIAKQRQGPRATVPLAFIDRYARFENLDDGSRREWTKRRAHAQRRVT